MEQLISKVLDLRFLEVKDLFYRLLPGKYRTQTCVPITMELTQIRRRRQRERHLKM